MEVTIFLSKKEEEIHEKFYLREQDDLLLEVAVSVASHSSGVRIIIEPSGSALEGSSSDQRLVTVYMIQNLIYLGLD